jgi:hypothetical protein
MVPHLITALNGPLLELESKVLEATPAIERWFRLEWQEHTPPFYCSVDLRNAGFKLAPVDTNLFPGGFNNLSPEMMPLAVQASMASIEKIAESVGLEMAVVCPDVFLKIAKDDTEEPPLVEEDELDLFYTGTFESITAVEFNTIFLLDDKNVKQEFVWLFSFEGDNLFVKNKIVKGDKLEIHYRQQEFFDPKQNKYRIYNEITSIKLL